MDYFIVAYTLIFVGVLVIPKGMLTVNILRECNTHREITITDKVMSYIPVNNSYVLSKALYGSNGGLYILIKLIPVMIGMPILLTNMLDVSVTVRILAVISYSIGIISWYIMEVVQTWRVAVILDKSNYRFFSLVPALGQYVLSGKVKSFFHKNRDIAEGTFDAKIR